jgi:hypothetical protein
MDATTPGDRSVTSAVCVHPVATAHPHLPVALMFGLVCAFILIRGWILFTALPSFSTTEDYDKWHDWVIEEQMDRSPILGAAKRLVDFSFREEGGGHRVGLALCILMGAIVPPSYLAVKALAILWGAAILLMSFWALRSMFTATTAILFAALFIFAPIRFLSQSHTLMGSHIESILFIIASLGFALRAVEAAHIGAKTRRDGMMAGLGFTMGVGLYFSESMWIWIASLLLILGIFRVAHGWRECGRASLAFLIGTLPGAVIIWQTYWPDHLSALFPYQLNADYYPKDLRIIVRLLNLSAMEDNWLRSFDTIHSSVFTAIGRSPAWIIIGVVFALVFGSWRHRLIAAAVGLYCFLLLEAANVTTINAPRHLMQLVFMGLLFQCLLLTQLLPQLGARLVPASVRSRTRTSLLLLGMVSGTVLLIPRIADAVHIAGRHALEDAWMYDARILEEFKVDGMDIQYIGRAWFLIQEIDQMALSKSERRVILAGARAVFGSGEHLNLDESLPQSVLSDVSSTAMDTRSTSDLELSLAVLEEQEPDLDPEQQELLYRCGLTLAQRVIMHKTDIDDPPRPMAQR